MNEIKIKVTARTNKVGSNDETEFSIDAEEWNELDEEQRKEACLEVLFEQLIEWNYEVVKD